MIISKFLTYEDLKQKGYDLNNKLSLADFNSKQEANDCFINDVVEHIILWISTNRGIQGLGNKYFEAFSDDDNCELYPSVYNALKKACIETAIFWLDNYDSESEIEKGDIKQHSPKAEKWLSDASIITYGC